MRSHIARVYGGVAHARANARIAVYDAGMESYGHRMRHGRISSPEQIDPRLVARTIDEGAATEHVALLDVLFELMESKLYSGKDELNDDEHTEVAWALEDGGYTVSRIPYESSLYRALAERCDAEALTSMLAPAIIDESSRDLYTLIAPKVLAERIAKVVGESEA